MTKSANKRVIVPLAPGFEEIEAVTIIDVLRRAEVEVVVAALDPGPVRGAHGITMHADLELKALPAGPIDMVVLPGGMPGAEHLANDADVQALLVQVAGAGGILAAICAAPMALGRSGICAARKTTCYPGFEERFEQQEHLEARVVIDGPIVTSRGPGTALEFALDLVAILMGTEVSAKLAAGMLVERSAAAHIVD